jgi:glycosyltransferase involved in cell wall biosynthesis
VVELTVVIPTYRRRDALPRALAALEDQTLDAGRFEVVVVDDPVDDDPSAVRELVQAASRPYATRQLSRARRGVSAARNAGWRAARAELVVFIGDDILLAPEALDEHLKHHRRDPDERVGVLGEVKWSRELRVTPFMRWLEQGIQFDYVSLAGDEGTWGHFYTSNVSVKRSMLEAVGGFDELRFPFLYEDIDIGHRMAGQGFRLVYSRRAAGEHLHETRLEDWMPRMAATAQAERMWVSLHPELVPYFHDRFTRALEGPPGSRLAARATGLVPRRLPLIGARVWDSADRYFSRRLGPAFLEAWASTGDRRTDPSVRADSGTAPL